MPFELSEFPRHLFAIFSNAHFYFSMKKLTVLVFLSFALIVTGACSKSARLPSAVTVAQEGGETSKHVTVVLGDVLLVEIPGDYQAGYVWDLLPLHPDLAGLVLQEGRFTVPDEKAKPGTPGKFTYVMRTIHVGEEKLTFVYRHHTTPKDQPPLKTFTINVTVR